MDQVACLNAVQNLISINAGDLVEGFVHQGQVRIIRNIAVSVLVAPSAYYFIVIHVRAASSQAVESGNMRDAHERCSYEVVVHIADAALAQIGEDIPFEQMTLDMRRLCDRLIAVLRTTRCFSALAPDNAHRFSMEPMRKVAVTNLDHWWSDVDSAQTVPILYSTLEFTLEETWATA